VISKARDGVPGGVGDDDEELRLMRCNKWAVNKGLAEGQLAYELTDQRGRQVAVLDLAWPHGVQQELTQPVCVLIDEDDEVEDAASLAGYRCFSSPHAFSKYVRREVLGDSAAEDAEAEESMN